MGVSGAILSLTQKNKRYNQKKDFSKTDHFLPLSING